jgi:hypothetical protein
MMKYAADLPREWMSLKSKKRKGKKTTTSTSKEKGKRVVSENRNPDTRESNPMEGQ